MSRPLTLRLTEAAEADLADIWSYVAVEASPEIATKLIGRIKAACDMFLHFPDAGPLRDVLAAGLRVIREGSYAIYYTHTEDQLVIVRVLHGARDAAALPERGGFARPGGPSTNKCR